MVLSYDVASINYYRPQTKFAKVMLCFYTCLSVHRVGVSRPRPREEVGGRAWGVSWPRSRAEGQGVWPGGCPGPHLGCPGPHPVGSRHRPGGVSRPRPGGCPGPDPWGMYPSTEADTTAAAGGTHPTGMHSCYLFLLILMSQRCHWWIQGLPSGPFS